MNTQHDIQLVRNCITHIGIRPVFDRLVKGTCYPSSIRKIDDWSWQFEINADTNIPYDIMDGEGISAGCSSMRLGDWHLRNFDWYINSDVECIVHTAGNDNRYESWGVLGGRDDIQEKIGLISSGYEKGTGELCVQNNGMSIISKLVDGSNAEGLFVNANVVPHMHRHESAEKGTNPGKSNLNSFMMVRYLLDNCATVDEAVSAIYNVNVFFPNYHGYELHWMVSDVNKTVIIELNPANGNWSVLEVGPDKPYPAIMTNFHITGTTLYEDGMHRTNADHSDSESHISAHGSGVERYNILYGIYKSQTNFENADEAFDACKSIFYKQYIADPDIYWRTEYAGEYDLPEGKLDVHIWDSDEIIDTIIDFARGEYSSKQKNLRAYYDTDPVSAAWATTHTTLFNLPQRTMHVNCCDNITDTSHAFIDVDFKQTPKHLQINTIVADEYKQLLQESSNCIYWESHITLSKDLEDCQSADEITPSTLENVFEIAPHVIHKHTNISTGSKTEERVVDQWYNSHIIFPNEFVLSFEDAVQAYWDSPYRTTGDKVTMRRPINPIFQQPYYIFGQQNSPHLVFVNAVTGEVSTEV